MSDNATLVGRLVTDAAAAATASREGANFVVLQVTSPPLLTHSPTYTLRGPS